MLQQLLVLFLFSVSTTIFTLIFDKLFRFFLSNVLIDWDLLLVVLYHLLTILYSGLFLLSAIFDNLPGMWAGTLYFMYWVYVHLSTFTWQIHWSFKRDWISHRTPDLTGKRNENNILTLPSIKSRIVVNILLRFLNVTDT